MKNQISKNLHVPLNSLSSVKTAKSSLARRGHIGGLTGHTRSWDPGPPPWVRGSTYKIKVLQDPGANTHTAATRHKEVLTPPTFPPKKGTPVRGGGGAGVKIQKIIGGSFLVLR